MDHDETVNRLLKEMKPELDRQWAEHERFIGLMADAAKTDEQKLAFEQYLRKRALGPTKRKIPYVGIAVLIFVVILTMLAFDFLKRTLLP